MTIGFPRFSYLPILKWFEISVVACPPTCIVEGCFLFLPSFLIYKSLIVFARIGISLIACNEGIFTHRFLNYASISNSRGTIGFLRVSLSGNGGDLES